MKNKNIFYYITETNQMGIAPANAILTSGSAENYFGSRNLKHYWEVNPEDPQTHLNACTKAIEAEVESKSVYNLIILKAVEKKDVKKFIGEEGLKLKETDNGYSISDGITDIEGASPISALFNWYSPDISIDKSNDEEE